MAGTLPLPRFYKELRQQKIYELTGLTSSDILTKNIGDGQKYKGQKKIILTRLEEIVSVW